MAIPIPVTYTVDTVAGSATMSVADLIVATYAHSTQTVALAQASAGSFSLADFRVRAAAALTWREAVVGLFAPTRAPAQPLNYKIERERTAQKANLTIRDGAHKLADIDYQGGIVSVAPRGARTVAWVIYDKLAEDIVPLAPRDRLLMEAPIASRAF